MSKEMLEALLDNTKHINELLEWKDQMYETIDALSGSVESLGRIVKVLDKDIQGLRGSGKDA